MMSVYRLAIFVLMVMIAFVNVSIAQTTVDLGDLNIDASRVPVWYAFDKTIAYNDAQTTWPEYDVTCENGPCGSGKTAWGSAPGDPFAACTSVPVNGSIANMQCFISAAPDDVVLYLPAGDYTAAEGVGMLVGNGNLVIRGAGSSTTTIMKTGVGKVDANSTDCEGNEGATLLAVCGIGHMGVSDTWTAGYSRGGDEVTVGTPGNYSVGGWIRLRMDGAVACEHIDKLDNQGWEHESFDHIAKVTNIAGSVITMDRPLRMDYDATGCDGWSSHTYTPVENFGFEGITLTSDPTIPQGGNGNTEMKYPHIKFSGVVTSWIVGSVVDRAYDVWFPIKYSARNWIQGNEFSDLDTTIEFNTHGIDVQTGAVDNVIENNYCNDTKVCSKIEDGAEGNVLAYNFTRQHKYACERTFFNHGFYTRETLFEGNDIDCELGMGDDFWGRNGPRNTAYRNRNSAPAEDCNDSRNAITIDHNGASWDVGHDINIIGNTAPVFAKAPKTGDSGCPALASGWISQYSENTWMENNAYRNGPPQEFMIGFFFNYSCGVSVNDTCPGTNKNVSAPDASWSGTYPTSLYRTEAPEWWCQEACEWDQTGIGAFGDDFGGTPCMLPAQIRVEAGDCTPLDSDPMAPAPSMVISGGAFR